MDTLKVVCGVSNRHLHLSQEDLEILFGSGATLTVFRDLKQPGQYACEEQVHLVGPRNTLRNVRVLGPVRKQTQIEISVTDSFALGLKPPLRDSGDLAGSEAITLEGPAGSLTLSEGVIIAKRHVHFHPSEAEPLGIKDKELIAVRVEGERGLVFENVLARVNEAFTLEFHVDIDEANSALLKNGDEVTVYRISL
ncbi:MAG: phosphate propanoyltransferase [Symbiobacteriaceae bacterium]|nr:phosphate propanoyltransferase [Symbiobacteriaceae bacterium]